MYPPGATTGAAFSSISLDRFAHLSTFSSLHSDIATSFFRNIPSPEQGTSAITKSKNARYIFLSSAVSSEVTKAFLMPSLSKLPTIIFALFGTNSFE